MQPVAILTSAGLAISIFIVLAFALVGARSATKQYRRNSTPSPVSKGNALYLALASLPAILLFLKDIVECSNGSAFLVTFLIYVNFLYGLPSLYLFVQGCFEEPTPKSIRHYLPTLANLPFALAIARTRIGSIGIDGELLNSASIPFVYVNALAAGETMQLVPYSRMIGRILNRHRKDHREPAHRWLVGGVLGCYTAYYGIRWVGLGVRLWSSRGRGLIQAPSWISPASVFVITSVIGIFGLYIVTRPEFLFPEKTSADKTKSRPKTVTDGEDKELVRRAALFLSKCENLDETNIDPRLLADHLGVPYYRLSQAVNDAGGLTVAELIRAARVDKAKILLAKRPDLSILEIAFDAGFPAKSSFNEAFKKVAGMNPSEYRKRSRLQTTSTNRK